MKKIILSITAIAILSIAIVSCGSKNTPKDAAVNFTKCVNNFDFEGAKKYSTPETGKMLDMLATIAGMTPDSVKEAQKKMKVEAKDEVITGDKAVVTIVVGDKGEEKVNLEKKDGKWLVHQSKDNGMGGDAGGMGVPSDGDVPEEEGGAAGGKDSVMAEKK